jgi:hypothetical protein
MTHTLDHGDDVEFKEYPNGSPFDSTQVLDTPGGPYRDDDGNLVADVELLAAVTGVVDEVGDVIVPGAFRRTLAEMKAKGVSAHDWKTPYAKALAREEWQPGDPRLPNTVPVTGEPWPAGAGGLYVKAQYNLETDAGKTAYANAKFYKDEQNFSIGYKVRNARKRGGVRYITDLDWYEWSDVLHGANKYAHLLSVKSAAVDGMEYTGIRPEQAETKARYVRDQEFWGLPYGTPIRLGMKPRGPKAAALRAEGKPVTHDMGTTTEKPAGADVININRNAGMPTPDVHGLATRLYTMQPSTAKATLKGYDTNELQQLDTELASRATQLGKDGQVSKAHQLVRDEIASRPDAGAPNAPQTPEAPKAAAPSAPDKPIKLTGPQERHLLRAQPGTVKQVTGREPEGGGSSAVRLTTADKTGQVVSGVPTPVSDALEKHGLVHPGGWAGQHVLTPKGEEHVAKLRANPKPEDPNAIKPMSAQTQHALLSAKPGSIRRLPVDDKGNTDYNAPHEVHHGLVTKPHGTTVNGLRNQGLGVVGNDNSVLLTPEGERHRQHLIDKGAQPKLPPSKGRAPKLTNNQKAWRDNPAGRLNMELHPSQRAELRDAGEGNDSKRDEYVAHRVAGKSHGQAMDAIKGGGDKPEPQAAEPDNRDSSAKAEPQAPATPEAPSAPEAAAKPAPQHRSRTISQQSTQQRTQSNRGRDKWLKSASDDELAQESANVSRSRSKLGGSTVSDGRAHLKHDQHQRAIDAEQRRRVKGGAVEPKVDHALMADRLNNDTATQNGPGGKAAHAASLAATALLGDEDQPTRSMTENVASALASGRDPGDMPDGVKPEDVQANLSEMADAIEHSGADLGDNGAYVQKLRDWTPPQAGDENGGEGGGYKPTGDMSKAGALSDDQLHAEHQAASDKLSQVRAAGETPNSAAHHDAKMAKDVFATELRKRGQDPNQPPAAAAPNGPNGPDQSDVNAGPAPEEQISPEELDQMQNTADEALGLSEDPEGQLEVTTDIADRQDRVSELLNQADAGTLDLTGMESDQLGATRQDVVDELRLQNEIHRRDAVTANASPITGTVTPPTGAPAAPQEVAKTPSAVGEPNASAAPESPSVPAAPKPKAGLAGAAEDYASAIEAGDDNRAAAARARLESSLRRSKTDSAHAQGLRDLLTEVEFSHPDADKIRTLSEGLRADTRTQRNATARDRRAAKRLERDKLRSLLGSIDAELRNRNLDPVTYGGPAPTDQPGVPTPGQPGMPGAPNAPNASGAAPAAAGGAPAAPTPEVAGTVTEPTGPALINKPATWATPAVVDQPAGQYFAGGPGGTQMVVGQNYVATIGQPDSRGLVPWSSRLYDQSGVPVDLQDGTAVNADDAQREIARGLADAYQKQYGGVPDGETLPTAPPQPEPAARTATIRKAVALAAAQSPDVNPVTGQRDFTEPTPLADAPVATPYKSIADVREHLAGVEKFSSRPNTIQWDTAMLSPGGGLFAARTSDRKGYTIFASANGAYIRMPDTALSNQDARQVMQSLERGVGPSGQHMDWNQADENPVKMTKAAGLGLNEMGAFAVAGVVAQRVANGDTTNPLVQSTAYQLDFSRQTDMAKTFPNYMSGNRALTTRIGNLGLLLHDGKRQKGRYATEDRTDDQLADDAETMRVANGARNVYMLGAPDKAIAMLERRADELSARYGGGASTTDPNRLQGDAGSRGSIHLRGIANEMRHSYSTTPVGTAALFEAQPGQRFMMYDTSPVSGNPNSTTPYARVFKVLGTAQSPDGIGRGSVDRPARQANSGSFSIKAVEEGAPSQTPVTLRVTGDSVEMPRWVESSPGKWSTMGVGSGNPVSKAIAPLAGGQQVPDTAEQAKALTAATPTDSALEAAISKARTALDTQLGAPKQRSAAATRRAKAPATRKAKVGSVTPEVGDNPAAQRALDTQTAVIDYVAGGPLNLLDAPPQSRFDNVDQVREAWRKGDIPDSLKQASQQQHQNFLTQQAEDEGFWRSARLSPGGWFFTSPNGTLTHAPSGKALGSFATQDSADRAGRYFETAVDPGTGRALDWSDDASGAIQQIKDTKQQLGIGLAGVITNRAKLDEAAEQGPGATKALLSDTPNAMAADVPNDVRVVQLNTQPYADATGIESPGLNVSRGDFPNRADEKNATELRKISAWATTMAPTHPYTVASTLAQLAEDHKGKEIHYRVIDPDSPDKTYYPNRLTKTGDMGAALKAMSDQVMHDADPDNWTNVERLASAGNKGGAKVTKVDVTPARLTSDTDKAYAERVAHAKAIAEGIRKGTVLIEKSVDSGNGWSLEFPGVDIPGHNDGPLLLKKTYQSTDSVSVNPDGSITATFRGATGALDPNESVYTVEIPADGWAFEGQKPPVPAEQ